MELPKEVIESVNLTEDQVKGITPFLQEQFATKQKEWDGLANKNAEGIIDGALKSIQKQFGIELKREDGEKAADYLTRYSGAVVGNKQKELDELRSDYETKIKGVKGTEALQVEYEKMKAEKDEILKKYADYDEVKEKASKYDEASQTLSTLKLEVAFNTVKPNFSESVNKYEAAAKWDEFKKNILEEYVIEIKDGVPIAIDKKNEYSSKKLEDLLGKDANIQELIKGRQQGGTGANPVYLKQVEGVPFKVPANADAKTRSKLIAEYLASKNIETISDEYSKEFERLNKTILQGQTQAA